MFQIHCSMLSWCGKWPPYRFLQKKSYRKQKNKTAVFDIETDLLGLPKQLSVSLIHNIYFRFDEVGLDVTYNWLAVRLPVETGIASL